MIRVAVGPCRGIEMREYLEMVDGMLVNMILMVNMIFSSEMVMVIRILNEMEEVLVFIFVIHIYIICVHIKLIMLGMYDPHQHQTQWSSSSSSYSVVFELSIASAFSRTVDVVGAGLHMVVA